MGLPALLGPRPVSFDRAMVQTPGAAQRMTAEALRDSLDALPALRRLLLQALEGFMAQVSQTAACNSRHHLVQRLARWLLMARDRVDGDELAPDAGVPVQDAGGPTVRRDARPAIAAGGGEHQPAAGPHPDLRPAGPGSGCVRLLRPRQGVCRGRGRQRRPGHA